MVRKHKWNNASSSHGIYLRLFAQLEAGKGSVGCTDNRAWYATLMGLGTGGGILVDYWKLSENDGPVTFDGDWVDIGYFKNIRDAKRAALNALRLNLGNWP